MTNVARVFISVLAVVAATAGAASAATQTYPENYKTEIRDLRPSVSGLSVEPAGGDKFLRLTNGSGKTVVVTGYDGDPYLRFLPSREVDVNLRSPSKYLNEDRFGTLSVPASARPGAAPKWQRVADSGTYRWFDHRIHWMERTVPPQVKDKGKRTKIFDWRVPLKADGNPVTVAGTLTWVPNASSSGISAGAIAGIAGGALVLIALVGMLLRRRRPQRAAASPHEKPTKEAW